MHRSVSRVLQNAGHTTTDVRDVGLRGQSDETIFKFAQEQKAVLLTGDLGFPQRSAVEFASHYGVVVARFPTEMSTDTINAEILKSLQTLNENDFKNAIIVISPGKVRIRRKK
jgi:predicted nuclease of predicted toxin-antitoxin system